MATLRLEMGTEVTIATRMFDHPRKRLKVAEARGHGGDHRMPGDEAD
jgi:hypothetical protein